MRGTRGRNIKWDAVASTCASAILEVVISTISLKNHGVHTFFTNVFGPRYVKK